MLVVVNSHSLHSTVNWLTGVPPVPHDAFELATAHAPAPFRPLPTSEPATGAAHKPGSPEAVTRIKTPCAAGAPATGVLAVAQLFAAVAKVVGWRIISEFWTSTLFSSRSCASTAASTPSVPIATIVMDVPRSVGLLVGLSPGESGCAILYMSMDATCGVSASAALLLIASARADTCALSAAACFFTYAARAKPQTQRSVARRIAPRIAPPAICATVDMGVPDGPPPEMATAVEESSGQVAAADASRRPADAGKPPDAKDARGTLVPPGQIAPAGQEEHEGGEPVVFRPQPMQAVRAVAPAGGSTSGAAQVRGAHVVEPAPDGVVRSLGQVKTPARQVDLVASGLFGLNN